MAVVYLICGFLGAGKTTFSKRMEKAGEGIRLNPDEECLRCFSPAEYEADWDRCFAAAVENLNHRALEYLQNGQNVIFDAGFWSRCSRDEAKAKFTAAGAEVKLYYLYAPDDVLKQRILSRQGGVAENNIRRFDDLKKLFEEPREEEVFALIDNF